MEKAKKRYINSYKRKPQKLMPFKCQKCGNIEMVKSTLSRVLGNRDTCLECKESLSEYETRSKAIRDLIHALKYKSKFLTQSSKMGVRLLLEMHIQDAREKTGINTLTRKYLKSLVS